ncbi:MAG: hypothetical protein AAGD04_03005 [Pseudomonadota bacterium]
MDGPAFERYTTGKTLFFGLLGDVPYGAEEYFPNRRVRWSFLDGRCIEGQWFETNRRICFVYEGELGQQCWEFTQSPNGLSALFVEDPNAPSPDANALPSTPLYEITDADEPLLCLGPEVGV